MSRRVQQGDLETDKDRDYRSSGRAFSTSGVSFRSTRLLLIATNPVTDLRF